MRSAVRKAFGRSFDLEPGYLNTTSISVPPTAAADAVVATRAGRARLAFHLYNTVEDVELALAALRPLMTAS